ncbi:hypothetical protein M409DRAFT_16402 [Zasmidium cellare ATCC 36951]|uniref:Dopa 4,5-dioxygenase n=1 Tax=Zasmidium cellare ATCC 36951 TaxID=1080233 RepID=A0A6A6D7B5_ZASCE|nr:uncharacterized protein M409DRAFT_16402 [Zasmidium cellare ATCC 36951]KAF2174132.1 hypothetical protein M409DRAFT_16402 [Zasmidium cellare ATCC 36951]
MDPWAYEYPSPLEGYENLEPLSEERNEDGKSLKNPPPTKTSEAYKAFPDPIANGSKPGFDIHIYFQHTDEEQVAFAKALHTRIRHEFPELKIFRFWDRPIGPHPVGMFEVDLFTPEQFGAFVPWLVVNRGPLSALVHPNTGSEYRDHTQRATWMGTPFPLITGGLMKLEGREKVKLGEKREGRANGGGS